jgi:hypothetical protein
LHYLHTQTPPTPTRKASTAVCEMLATTIHKSNTTPHHQSEATTTNPKPYSGRHPHPTAGSSNLPPVSHTGRRDSGPVVSKPNSVSDEFSRSGVSPPLTRLLCTRPPPTTGESHPQNRSGSR